MVEPRGTMTQEAPEPREDRLIFPFDLREWAPTEILSRCIREKIETLNWGNPELIAYLSRHPKYRPKELLTLLSWAYSTGVFESQVIEQNCFSDAGYRSICVDFTPTAAQLSRFRRENRGLLKWIMAEILKEALKEKYSLGNTLLPAGLRRFLVNTAVERLDLARHMDCAGHD